MGEPLSPERVAEIRQQWGSAPRGTTGDDVRALCDTVDALRAERDEVNLRLGSLEGDLHLLAQASGAPNWKALLKANEGLGAALFEERRELETLRDIARRVADGWLANGVLFNGWMRPTGGGPPYEVEPMTEAEVKAIYGGLDVRAR